MIVARWSIEAKFGYKNEVIASMKRWQDDFGERIGWKTDKMRLLTGSVGGAESVIVNEVVLQDLAELNTAWKKLAELDGHKAWSKKIEPHIVSGSNRWEIYNLV